MTVVSGPTIGFIACVAVPVSQSFTQISTTSAVPSATGSSLTRTAGSSLFPNSLSTESPCSRMAAKCSPRATKPTSHPPCASLAPKYPPTPPAPITVIRINIPFGSQICPRYLFCSVLRCRHYGSLPLLLESHLPPLYVVRYELE